MDLDVDVDVLFMLMKDLGYLGWKFVGMIMELSVYFSWDKLFIDVKDRYGLFIESRSFIGKEVDVYEYIKVVVFCDEFMLFKVLLYEFFDCVICIEF